MVVDQVIDPRALVSAVLQPQDGLLAYLSVLYRVAHEPAASHWCTPGHNRGGEMSMPPEAVAPIAPMPGARAGA